MRKIVLWFIKITGFFAEIFYYRRKTYYINKKEQGRKIKRNVLIVSNHKSLYDFPLYIFTFFLTDFYVLVAETMYQKNKLFSWFLNSLGGIKVNRNAYDFSFMSQAINKLEKGKTLLIFPESRIPKENEKDLLDFKPSFVYIALESNTPILPVYTNGSYKNKKRTRVLIGEKIYLNEMLDSKKNEKENIDYLCQYVRNYIKNLGEKLNAIEEQEKDKNN